MQPGTAREPMIVRYRFEVVMILLVLLLGFGVFMFFKSFFDTEINSLTSEILAAFLGSIITVMITMLIVRQQGSIEQAQQTAAAHKTMIFKQKLDLFKEFLAAYAKSVSDGKLAEEEVARMEELAMNISLLSHEVRVEEKNAAQTKTVRLPEEISRFILQLELFGLKDCEDWGEQERRTYKEHFGQGQDGEEPRLVSIIDVMRLMKQELERDQVVAEEMGDKADSDRQAYAFTEKMLRHATVRKRTAPIANS